MKFLKGVMAVGEDGMGVMRAPPIYFTYCCFY